AAILAGASSELTGSGYSRKTLTNVTVTVDDTGNKASFTADPVSWTITGSSPEAGKAIVAYDPDTTTGDDDDLIPLAAFDCEITFDAGVEVTVTPNPNGLAVAQDPS